MTTTVSGSTGYGVSLNLSSTQNMLVAKQLSLVISSGSAGIEKLQAIEINRFGSPDTVSLMAGTTTGSPAASIQSSTGAVLFIGTASASSVLAGLGNTTLEGGIGKPFTLAQGLASLNGGLGKEVVDFVSGKAAGTETLVDFAKVVAPVAKVDLLTPANTTAGTTITLSDATKITFQAALIHNPTVH